MTSTQYILEDILEHKLFQAVIITSLMGEIFLPQITIMIGIVVTVQLHIGVDGGTIAVIVIIYLTVSHLLCMVVL